MRVCEIYSPPPGEIALTPITRGRGRCQEYEVDRNACKNFFPISNPIIFKARDNDMKYADHMKIYVIVINYKNSFFFQQFIYSLITGNYNVTNRISDAFLPSIFPLKKNCLRIYKNNYGKRKVSF